MIISRTPLRISFAGGGSDIEWFYKKNEGAVVSTAIDKYIYITVNKKFDNKIRASYSKTEIVDNISQLKHDLIKESLKMTGIPNGVEITSISDIPSEGTGLGSSSSYTVGLLHVLYAYKNKFVSAENLAQESYRIEVDILKKPIGKQDQYIAAYGGLRYFQFNRDGSVFTEPIICSPETKRKLQENLLMFYTGLTRSSGKILKRQGGLFVKDIQKAKMMDKMVDLAKEMKTCLEKNKLNSFGEIMHQNWMLKKKLSDGITNEKIEKWYNIARRYGAIGGKIAGAGGGGFLVLYAPKSRHLGIIRRLSILKKVGFALEPEGSKIIFVGG